MPDDDLTMLGGYRLVRRLGSGSRADVYLGAGASATAVLKIYRESTPRDDIGRELDALGRLDSPHCVRLVDVVTAASGLPAAILSRASRGSLAQLLRERGSIEPGEAVTLLAPLVGAVREAHRAGVAHTRIGAASVHLGAEGEPVLLGFGHVSLVGTAPSIAVLDTDAQIERDRDALAAVAVLALLHVRGVAANRLATDLVAWIESSAGDRRLEFGDQLESRLFDLAEAVPIEFGRVRVIEPGPRSAPLPERMVATRPQARVADTRPPVPQAPADPAPLETLPGWIPEWVHDAIMGDPLAAFRSRFVASLRGVRRPVWIALVSIVVALVAALALVPQGSGVTAAIAHPLSSPAGGAQRLGSHATGSPGIASSPEASQPATSTAVPTATDDPLIALPVLIAVRDRCIQDRAVECLGGVDEANSAALTTDSLLVRTLQDGAEVPPGAVITASAPALIERLGDSALVSLAGPKSVAAPITEVLMIKDRSGWRIRSFSSGKPLQSTTGTAP
jgi:hypothetical protein